MKSRNAQVLAIAGTIVACMLPSPAGAQALTRPQTGPVIEGYGPVFEVLGLDVPAQPGREYRAVFDVSSSPDAKDQLNPSIETLARFLNMHARARVPLASMKLALVLHGSAGKDALADGPYRDRYGVNNPNRELIDRLRAAGVEIVLCGQTAMNRGLAKEQLNPSVKLALSAMTALVSFQSDGYRLIAF